MELPVECLEGYCLVEAPGATKSAGGIVMPDIEPETDGPVLKKLKVVQIGRGEQMDAGRRREVVVVPGQTYYFLFPRYSMEASVTLNGQKFLFVQSKFVIARERSEVL